VGAAGRIHPRPAGRSTVANRRQRNIGRLLLATTTEEMLRFAAEHDLLVDDRIDLRGAGVRFDHEGLDLRRFLFQETRLGASRLVNCTGAGVAFEGCSFAGAWIGAGPGKKISFEGASFADCRLTDVILGPRTLDLRGASFRGARLEEVTFRMGRLEGASFARADLKDVYFRSALLTGADFRGARLCRVSFEKASLDGIDLTGAKLDQMDFWGHDDLVADASHKGT
jgi:uncharacterized protein YjbI with pentapeptide repeats